MMTHNIMRHLKSLRQTLSQDKKPIGFFISAGCPLSIEITPPEDWPLIPDMKKLSEYVTSNLKSSDPTNLSTYERLISELEKTNKSKENLEDILSFIRSLKDVAQGGGTVRGLTETELENLETDIQCRLVKDLI